jgi:CRISPR-associated protein Cas1
MDTLYISGQADLSRDENTLLVLQNKVKKYFPVEQVNHLILTSDGTITTKLFALCGSYGIRISFFDHYGWYKGSFEPINSQKSGIVKNKQGIYLNNIYKRLYIARQIVGSTIKNMISNLKYYFYKGNKDINYIFPLLEKYILDLNKCLSIEELMGFEGISRRAYYETWKIIDKKLEINKRRKRPPNNEINCLISFLNGLVYATMRHEIFKSHLSEPFKVLITDRLIFKIFRKNILNENWFTKPEDNICLLSQIGRKNIIELYSTYIDKPIDKENNSYRLLMRKEALSLEKHLFEIEEFTSYVGGY